MADGREGELLVMSFLHGNVGFPIGITIFGAGTRMNGTMKKYFLIGALMALGVFQLNAQQTYVLPTAKDVKQVDEHVSYRGDLKDITGEVQPSVEVYLPSAEKANGCAVVLCPGGGMRALSWTTDVEQMARFLNERGIAAIGLKYRLNNTGFPKGVKMGPMVDVTAIDHFPDADANPLHYEAGDSVFLCAAQDAMEAVKLVRRHAEDWHIDVDKVGYMGFSAGGGVALAATMLCREEAAKPSFICTNYGPSLMPVSVPEQAPPLLILSRVDHPNVAAGLVGLFLEWKKAGANAELHLFGDGRGPYALMPETGDTTTENWGKLFLQWLSAKGFAR